MKKLFSVIAIVFVLSSCSRRYPITYEVRLPTAYGHILLFPNQKFKFYQNTAINAHQGMGTYLKDGNDIQFDFTDYTYQELEITNEYIDTDTYRVSIFFDPVDDDYICGYELWLNEFRFSVNPFLSKVQGSLSPGINTFILKPYQWTATGKIEFSTADAILDFHSINENGGLEICTYSISDNKDSIVKMQIPYSDVKYTVKPLTQWNGRIKRKYITMSLESTLRN